MNAQIEEIGMLWRDPRHLLEAEFPFAVLVHDVRDTNGRYNLSQDRDEWETVS